MGTQETRPSAGNPLAPEDALAKIRTRPLVTGAGKPYDWKIRQQVDQGDLRLEVVPAEVLGLSRPLAPLPEAGS